MDPGSTSTMVNISGISLSDAEFTLLSRGLSFCPTLRHFDKTQILDDLKRFYRQLRLKEFSTDLEKEDSGVEYVDAT